MKVLQNSYIAGILRYVIGYYFSDLLKSDSFALLVFDFDLVHNGIEVFLEFSYFKDKRVLAGFVDRHLEVSISIETVLLAQGIAPVRVNHVIVNDPPLSVRFEVC